jgi:rhodanese-related sulfurtransferase
VIRQAARQAFLLGALALLPAIGQAWYMRDRVSWQKPPAGDEVTVTEARRWGDAVIWIDARPEDEFRAAHIPGALLLNTEGWDTLVPQVLNQWAPDRKLVVYCSKQTCGASREVARRLRDEAGLRNVHVLGGGWEAWQESLKQ